MDDAVLEKASSFIDIMKSLFLSENPLYERVDRTIDLQPMDYYESSLFIPVIRMKLKHGCIVYLEVFPIITAVSIPN